MTKVTIESLEAAGYRWFRDGLKAHLEGNLGIWQKTFSDAGGERFALTVRVWARDPERYPDMSPHSFSPIAQFVTGEGLGTSVNVEMLHVDESLEEVEAFFQRMFDAMGFAHCRPRRDAA